jgi:hypothetical protein
MILAVTHRGDDHADRVLDALARRGAEIALLDLASIPRLGRVALRYGRGGAREILAGGSALDLGDVTAVWWRRPRPPAGDPSLRPEHAAFAARQAFVAVVGAVTSLERQALLVSHPFKSDLAAFKTHQLAAAERIGLPIPATLVTSDPAAARAFLRARGKAGAIHKALHATPDDWRRTQRVGRGGGARLDSVRLAPVIFQERIPGVDVRATVVGQEIFAAEIDARASSSPDDYRGREDECRFAPCTLPAKVARGLRGLVREMGLEFAAVDFRRRDDGAWFFLELNPAGQWDFVEDRTGQPITEALAALLARGHDES